MASEDTALTALEHRVRQRVLRSLGGVVSHISVALTTAARARPNASAAELLSSPDVHQVVTAELARASTTVQAAVQAAYTAGAKLGDAQARVELRKLGHTVTGSLPDGGEYLEAVRGDIERAFSSGLLDVQNTITEAFDGVTGRRAGLLRRLTVHAALRRVARRLNVSASAATMVAVSRGYADAHGAAWADYTETNPYVKLVKTWHVRGPNPCASCRALNGTTVGIDGQFDRTAGAPERILPVYRDLYRPPRHPQCHCRVSYGFARDDRLGPLAPIRTGGGAIR